MPDYSEIESNFLGLDRTLEADSRQLARLRGTTARLTKSCTSCHLARTEGTPVPISVPSQASCAEAFGKNAPIERFGVIGEAPGEREVELGRPFVGKSGKYLRAMMTSAGLDPDEGAWMNTISCRPEGNATPKMPEIQACRMNLMDSIRSANTPYLLLVGATALTAWRTDLRISKVHGMIGVWMNRYVVMPIYHPAAILRDRSLSKPTSEDLMQFAEVISDITHPVAHEYLSRVCVKCIDRAVIYDRDAVPYCEIHWRRYGGTWKKERKKWNVQDVDTPRTIQGTLL